MKRYIKILSAAACLLLASRVAWSTSTGMVLFFSTQGVNLSGTATQYFGSQLGITTQEGFVRFVIPQTGTLTALNASLGSSTGTTVFTVVINGSTTAVTCTTVSVSTCSDTGHSVSVNSGDTVSIQSITDGSSNVNKTAKASVLITAVSPLPVIHFASEASLANTTEFFTYNINPTESAISIPSPITGTVKNLVTNIGTASPTGPFAFTIFVNGSATSITCSGVCSDTTHTAAVTAGQTLSVQYTGSSGGAANRVYASFQIQ